LAFRVMSKRHKSQGELAVIQYLRKRFPKRRREVLKGIGDDAMVFRDGYVVTTDSFFEKTHFDLGYFSFFALGYHTMAASLSDLAAMGASPISALVSLCISENINIKAVHEVYDGFEEVTRKYKCDISGGDIVNCQAFGMTITVVGRTKKPLLRSGATPGNYLYVTNFLGLAEAGRMVLKAKGPRNEYPDAIKKHLYPEPRINEALSLRKLATSCIDISDGLSTDAYHLAEESGVKIVIDAEHIPILSSGEDFELLFTASRLPAERGMRVFRIGRIMKGKGLYLSVRGKLQRIEPSGYEHLNT
jgi:thiamine-monophosphate kinase